MTAVDRPATEWRGRTAPEWAAVFGTPEVHLFRSAGSTNAVARALAERGAPPGTTVIADEQTAGRGRHGRSWSSPPGAGVWMSVLMEPAAAPALLPLLLAVRVAERLAALEPGLDIAVKWPNDLLGGGRKLGGILCDAQWSGDTMTGLVAGIGINVSQQPADFPPEVSATATSLHGLGAGAPRHAEVAIAVRAAISEVARIGCSGWPAALKTAWPQWDALAGNLVRVAADDGRTICGTARGIDAAGALRVVDEQGREHVVQRGTVRRTQGLHA